LEGKAGTTFKKSVGVLSKNLKLWNLAFKENRRTASNDKCEAVFKESVELLSKGIVNCYAFNDGNYA
jgi:hypothetical protein